MAGTATSSKDDPTDNWDVVIPTDCDATLRTMRAWAYDTLAPRYSRDTNVKKTA
jgi:hypothetical protein